MSEQNSETGPGTTEVVAETVLPTAAGAEAPVDEGTPDEGTPDDGTLDRRDRPTAARRLEEEGDVAADYLEELLDIVDLDGDIDIDVENGRASVSVVADAVSTRSLRRLVGPEGQVLEALQELTRLAVQARTGERSRLMLDVAGFRAARRTELVSVAERAVAECRRSGAPVPLDPMTPFERKVVHDAVAAAGLKSESEGEEPSRRVVVLPANGA
jgi:spoIIIJ-associated protein